MLTQCRSSVCSLILASLFAGVIFAQDSGSQPLAKVKNAWMAREKSLETFSMKYEVRSVQASLTKMVNGEIVPTNPNSTDTLTAVRFFGSGSKLKFDVSKLKSGSIQENSTLLYDGQVVTELFEPNADSPTHKAVKSAFNRSSLKMVRDFQPLLLLTRPITIASVDLDHATLEAQTTIRQKVCTVFTVSQSRYFVQDDGLHFPILRLQRLGKDGPTTQYDFMYADGGRELQPMFWTHSAGLDANTVPSLSLGVVLEFNAPHPANANYSLDLPSKTHVLDISGPDVKEYDVP